MKLTSLLALGSALASAGVFAVPVSEFGSNVAKGLRLIQISDDVAPFWATEQEKLDLRKQKKMFFDLTETYHIEEEMKAKNVRAVVERATFPAPSHATQVNAIIGSLSTTNMDSYLSTLTAFNNRYYKASTGLSASNSIYSTLTAIANGKTRVTVTKFSHSWTQQSIIAKIAGTSTSSVILGAHEDSINLSSPTSGRAPGADDDGTGTVNLIEVFRAIVASGFQPTRTLEFHFYSGEEGGLLGSQAIAANYKSSGKSVYAYLNLDMTGYWKPGTTESIALITDNTDSGLTSYLKTLVSTYCKIPAVTTTCGYSCSDHASWNKQGYPAGFPFETTFGNDNPNIHSTRDTTSVTGFSWAHSLEFAKLAAAFAVELGA
ncbi:Peptidase family M28 protein [Ceratobasidium sp. AG-Ba]|nr:Peptidase family M28 protein [Ceratobasidium sp. AG-Ba]QRW03469.1 Peptidase family M28 protein [Ceratobasidium sp. AG-Ba]